MYLYVNLSARVMIVEVTFNSNEFGVAWAQLVLRNNQHPSTLMYFSLWNTTKANKGKFSLQKQAKSFMQNLGRNVAHGQIKAPLHFGHFFQKSVEVLL